MCGRYVLALRPSEVRRQLEQSQMAVDDAPGDDDVRPTYNFAPGYHGLVYRAEHKQPDEDGHAGDPPAGIAEDTRYKLQAMKWGLVPFWTKRNPDYGSLMRTINCRDDSLLEDRGMWTSMKKKKRCIVVAQGFYEWLKKKHGKERIPHFTRRKDGRVMCFAGLWDCVKFEDSDEMLYTYTVITTDSNKQLNFLHDRMPVMLENGSEAIRTWLDPNRTEWTSALQSLLKPFEGELECYPVSKDVGKVGNNSPAFIVPVDSAANKQNIANFFGNQPKAAAAKVEEVTGAKTERDVETSMAETGIKMEHDINETRGTSHREHGTENNAPLPNSAPSHPSVGEHARGIKRERSDGGDGEGDGGTAGGTKKKSRSATSNGSAAKTGTAKRDGSRKITAFFGRQR